MSQDGDLNWLWHSTKTNFCRQIWLRTIAVIEFAQEWATSMADFD